MFKKLVCLLGIFLSTSILAAPPVVVPEQLKNQQIYYVVGYSPGGLHDTISRYFVKYLGEKYNLNISLLNKPGANGAISAAFASTAEPNGSVIYMNSEALTIAVTQKQPTWPSRESLVPVANVYSSPMMLIGASSLKGKSFQEVLELIKKNPGKYNYAHNYVIDKFETDKILNKFNISGIGEIPYKNTSDIRVALANDTVHLWFASVLTGVTDSKAGLVTPLLVTTSKRLKEFPQVPTMGEFIPGSLVQNYSTIYLPEKTPQNIVSFYNAAFNQMLSDPVVINFLETSYVESLPTGSVDEVQKIISAKWDKWKSGIK